MNKIYRVIWNTSLGIWMAVSELAKSNTKSKSQTVVFDTIQQYNNTTILVEKHLLNAHRNKLNLALATTTIITLFVPSLAFADALDGGSVYTNCNPNNVIGNGTKATQSVAVGQFACAPGNQSVALGANTHAAGNSSIAIGGDDLDLVARGTAGTATAGTKNETFNSTTAAKQFKDLTGSYLVDVEGGKQYLSTKSGAGSVAVGVMAQANASLSTAFGTRSEANVNSATALGTGATANKAGSIALGAGTVTDGNATQESEAEVNGLTFDGFAGNVAGAGSQVSVGKIGNERQIKNVASGAISEISTDAINGSQLYATNKVLGNLASSVATELGGNAAVSTDGKITMSDVGGTGETNINDAIQSVNDTASKGINFGDGKTDNNFALGDTINVTGDSNITTETTADGVQVKLNPNLDLGTTGSVTTGNTTVNNSGVTITNVDPSKTVALTDAGLNNGGNKITNVGVGSIADGSKDAVNGSQIHDLMGSDAGLNNGGNKITNVGVGSIADGSKDAVNGSQIHDLMGSDAYVDGNGDTQTTVQNIGGTGETNINDAIQNINDAQKATNDFAVKYDKKPDGSVNKDSVTFAGTTATPVTADADGKMAMSGGTALNNVASAGDYTDVNNAYKGVNAGDLNNAVADVTNKGLTFGANAGADYTAKLGTKVSVKGANANTDFSEFDAGDNIMTQVDASGNIVVALKKDAKFDSVNAGGTVINANGLSFVDGAGNLVANSPSISRTGINAGNQKITNVKDGSIGAGSKDAVNGGQIHDLMGAGAYKDADGKPTDTVQNIGGTGANNINDAIQNINDAAANANAGWNVSTNGGAASNVKPGDTVDFSGDGNVVISNDGNKVTASLADNVTIGSGVNAVNIDGKNGKVNIGDSTLNSDGLTIAGGPSVTKDGIDAAGNKVTNVGDGKIETGSKDAVNGGQIADIVSNINTDIANATAAATSKVEAGDNISVSESKNADGSTTYNVATKKDVSFDNVNVGDVSINKDKGINAGNKVISGVANGAVNKDSKEAINGSQLNTTNQAIVDYLGGGAGYDNITGSFTAPSYNVGDKKYNNVGSAIDALNQADQALNNKIDNVDQKLDNAFRVTNDRIDDVEKKANAGIAAAMALESAPYIPGKYTYAAGAAYHGGENAIGVTLRKTADNGRWSLTGGVAAASQGDPSVRIGISGVID